MSNLLLHQNTGFQSYTFMILFPNKIFLHLPYKQYFLKLSIYILRRPQEGHECIQKPLKKACPACERNDTKTVEPFVLWNNDQDIQLTN